MSHQIFSLSRNVLYYLLVCLSMHIKKWQVFPIIDRKKKVKEDNFRDKDYTDKSNFHNSMEKNKKIKIKRENTQHKYACP